MMSNSNLYNTTPNSSCSSNDSTIIMSQSEIEQTDEDEIIHLTSPRQQTIPFKNKKSKPHLKSTSSFSSSSQQINEEEDEWKQIILSDTEEEPECYQLVRNLRDPINVRLVTSIIQRLLYYEQDNTSTILIDSLKETNLELQEENQRLRKKRKT